MKALELVDHEGQHLGSVTEVILDINTGRVIAVSLLIADQVATSPEMLVIPWDSVTFDHDCNCLRLVGRDRETLAYRYGDGLVN
jgi:hypothetical protein